MISRYFKKRRNFSQEAKYQEDKFWLEEDELNSIIPSRTKIAHLQRQEGSQEWKLLKEIRRMKVSDKEIYVGLLKEITIRSVECKSIQFKGKKCED